MRIRKRPIFASTNISLPPRPSFPNPFPDPSLPLPASRIAKNPAPYFAHHLLLHAQQNCPTPHDGHPQYKQSGNAMLRSWVATAGHAMQRSSAQEIELPRSTPSTPGPGCKVADEQRKDVDETIDTRSFDGSRSSLAVRNDDGVEGADHKLVGTERRRDTTTSSVLGQSFSGSFVAESKDACRTLELVVESLHKKRKTSRYNLPPSSTFTECYSGRSRLVRGFVPKGSLASVLFHMVSEAGNDGITVCEAVKRLASLKYTQLLEADGLPRAIQVGKVLRSNPRIAERGNGKFVMRRDEGEASMIDADSVDGGGEERRKEVVEAMKKKRCNRKDGRGWQCGEEALDGCSYCEYHLVKVQANHARSIERLASAKKKKRVIPLLTFG